MNAVQIDPNTREIVYSGGRPVIITGAEVVRQNVDVALNTFLGEWRFNVSHGTDWFGRVLGKGKRDDEIRAEIKRVVQGVAGVSSVDEINLTRDPGTRRLTISWRATVDTTAISGTVGSP